VFVDDFFLFAFLLSSQTLMSGQLFARHVLVVDCVAYFWFILLLDKNSIEESDALERKNIALMR